MRSTFKRFDGWFVKGFDGLRNLLIDRSNVDVKPTPYLLFTIRRLLRAIDAVKTPAPDVTDELVTDAMFADATAIMASFLETRIAQGKLTEQQSRDLLALYHPLQTVLNRLENHGSESS